MAKKLKIESCVLTRNQRFACPHYLAMVNECRHPIIMRPLHRERLVIVDCEIPKDCPLLDWGAGREEWENADK